MSEKQIQYGPCAAEWDRLVRTAILRSTPRVRVRALRVTSMITFMHPGFGLSAHSLERAAAQTAARMAADEQAYRAEQHARQT